MPYYGRSRRGYGRRYGRYSKRRKFASRARGLNKVRRSVVRGAQRAALNNTTSQPMCRDLGTLWPGCITVKLKKHFFIPLTSSGGALSSSAGYIQYFNCYPYQPFSPYPTDVSGFTVKTTNAVGWNRLITTASNTASTTGGIYLRCCVLKMQYSIVMDIIPGVTAAALGTNTGPNVLIAPSTHYVRPYDNTGINQQSPSTQAAIDQNIAGGDMIRWKELPARNIVINATTAAPAQGPLSLSDPPVVRWRGTVYPHKVLDLPFDQYVANETSFGGAASLPSDYANLELGGFSNDTVSPTVNTAGLTVYARGQLTFTCLFKDVNANVF